MAKRDDGLTWSDGDTVADPVRVVGEDDFVRTHPLTAPEGRRYSAGKVLGVGGIGRVLAVEDCRLGREVAYKELIERVGSEDVAKRFVREAWVTAQLEHPGIVPVYDGGVRDDGSLFYTMRYVRGRSLRTALDQAADLRERLELLGHFAQTCQAMAYAHSRGVIHRDLKPSNIMVGEFGETQIVDWGLARVRGEVAADPSSPSSERSLSDLPSQMDATAAGALMGTPGYMSPEQARCAEVDERSDVWSLGVILYELLTGRRPFESLDAIVLIQLIQDAEFKPPREREAGAPAELCAIVERALCCDAEARYPSARELRADVDSYLAGGWVDAYRYSTWDLLVRLVRPHLTALLVTLVALVAVAGTMVDRVRRVGAERDIAVTARTAAVEAEQRSRTHLASALVEKALAAAHLEAVAEAEVLAAHALVAQESPFARGVLARFGLSGQPELVRRGEMDEGCKTVALSADGRRVVCTREEDLWIQDLGRDRPPWVVPLRGVSVKTARLAEVMAVAGREEVSLLDLSGTTLARVRPSFPFAPREVRPSPTGRWLVFIGKVALHLVDRDGTEHTQVVCPQGVQLNAAGFDDEEGQLAAGCSDGSVWLMGTSELEPRRVATVPESVMEVALAPDGSALLVGSVHGGVWWLDLEEGEPMELPGLRASVSWLGWSPNGTIAGGVSNEFSVQLWDPARRVALARLPAVRNGALATVVGDDRLHVAGVEHQEWVLPRAFSPVTFGGGSGLSSAELGPAGQRVVTTDGTGHTVIWSRQASEELGRHSGQGVVKRAAFSPDGRWIATGLAGIDGLRVLDAHNGAEEVSLSKTGVLRVGFTPQGTHLFAVDYTRTLRAWTVDDWVAVDAPEGSWRDSWFTPGPTLTTVDTYDGVVWSLESDGDGLKATPLGSHQRDALAYALSPDGTRAAVSERGNLVYIIDLATGGELRSIDVGKVSLHVAWSPDGRLLATSHLDRTAQVFDVADGGLRLVLEGHSDRVVYLSFDATGRELLTASWDGTARLWDIAVLDRPVNELVAAAEASWGLDLDAAIAIPLR